MQGERQRPRLSCLAGEPADSSLLEDAGHLAELSPQALKSLWQVLEPCLVMPMSPQLEQGLSVFCGEHGIEQKTLGHMIRALSTLVRGAARVSLPREAFARDLEALWPGQSEAHEAFLVRYDEVTATLQKALFVRALSDHGNVLTGIDWRVDHVIGDKNAPRLALPVAMVTLSYQRRGEKDHVTLQLASDELQRMATVFAALAEQTARVDTASRRPPTSQEASDGTA